MAFLKCHLIVISLQPLLAFKILARNYNSPRTISVKVETVPVVAKPILHVRAIKSTYTCSM